MRTLAVTNSFHQIMFGMESASLWILVAISNRQAINAIGQDDMDANWALVFWLTVICAEPFCILCVIYHFASPNIISHYQGNFVHCYGVTASQAIILFIISTGFQAMWCIFVYFLPLRFPNSVPLLSARHVIFHMKYFHHLHFSIFIEVVRW